MPESIPESIAGWQPEATLESNPESVTVIGAGLAGCEAAWQLARRGVPVRLCEMKPAKRTPAHHADSFAELVCSNSLRSNVLSNAAGLLKEELRRLGSLILACADATQVEAGSALAVDREAFTQLVTEQIQQQPLIALVPGEVTAIPEGRVIIASGPLTSDALFAAIAHKLQTIQTRPEKGDGSAAVAAIASVIASGETERVPTDANNVDDTSRTFLHFYDAAAPIVTAESIDAEQSYVASRYGKGTADYINCPLTRDEYQAFWEALTTAEAAPVHGFEDHMVFEGCMPIEVNARRGQDTLRFGILKPIGLPDPRTGKDPYAVLQLRRDNAQGSLYNLVGCQTHLKFGEQQRVFSLIPALRHAEFVRYGVMHRNTFLDSPRLLNVTYALKADPRIRFAGQITGVEGYVESTASGLVAGIAAACEVRGETLPVLSRQTAIGALACYISDHTVTKFQPMNINFGLLDPLDHRVRGKQERNTQIAERALAQIDNWKRDHNGRPESDSQGIQRGEPT